jgi:PQQ-like domain
MARLSTVRCPNCGANVRLEVAAEWVTCGYCKTEAYVQRPKAPPPPPRAVAVVQAPAASSGAVGLVVGAGALLLLLGGLIAFAVFYESSTLDDVAIQSPAMLFDVNRDGAKDALMAALGAGQGAIHVRALDARTGSTLWKSEDLADARGSEFALNADVVLVVNGARMLGLDARTGKQRFTQTLPERLENACEDENHFYLELADRRRFEVDPRTGGLTQFPTPAAPEFGLAPSCPPAWGSGWQAHGQFVSKASWDAVSDAFMNPDVRLQYAREPTLLLIGERPEGSRVPMLAGFRDNTTVWRTILPGKNPLEAKEGEPSGSTLTADRAYATYGYADGSGFALVGVAMKDGARLWETRITRKSDPGRLTLSADDQHVFVFASSAMHGVSASTGQLLWSVGWGLGH